MMTTTTTTTTTTNTSTKQKSIKDELDLLAAIRDTYEIGLNLSLLLKKRDKILTHPLARAWSAPELLNFLHRYCAPPPLSTVKKPTLPETFESKDSINEEKSQCLVKQQVSQPSSPITKHQQAIEEETIVEETQISTAPVIESKVTSTATIAVADPSTTSSKSTPAKVRKSTRMAGTLIASNISVEQDKIITRDSSPSVKTPLISKSPSPYQRIADDINAETTTRAATSIPASSEVRGMRTRSAKRKEPPVKVGAEPPSKAKGGIQTPTIINSNESTPAPSPANRPRRTPRR